MKSFDSINTEYARWLKETQNDASMQDELRALEGNREALAEAFGYELCFGTSGIRGIMGPGPCCLNKYVVRRATQGLADYIHSQALDAPSVVISYDSRYHSKEFAEETAKVLSGNDIKAWIFDSMTPVPILTYAIGQLTCDYGIMITASHNTGIYNGYKVYNRDGYQVLSPEPEAILDAISKLDFFSGIKMSDNRIIRLNDDIPQRFIKEVLELQEGWISSDIKNDIKIIYTPLNGTGNKYVRQLLSESGFNNVTVVHSQENPDGSFATCKTPNPEKIAAYNEAFRLMDAEGGDVIIATDPDSDRVGAALIHSGTKVNLSGNQLGVLILDFLCHVRTLKEGKSVYRSVATTPMIDLLAKEYGLNLKTTLTGFKYIGEAISKMMHKGESSNFFCGIEESNGYLFSPFIRDKDGISSALIIASMVALYKSQGMDLIDRLEALAEKYGECYERPRNYTFDGIAGKEAMEKIMTYFREEAVDTIGNIKIEKRIDYLTEETDFPKTDMIEYHLEDGSRAIVRPSGTESKIKVYAYLTANNSPIIDEINSIMNQFKLS